MQSGRQKGIESLYVLKAICAFFVVCIHIPLPVPVLEPFLGVGVPCFLCISGYLLYSADRRVELGKCIAWAKKAFFLAIALNIINGTISSFILGKNVFIADWVVYVKTIFLGTGICGVLWYLHALGQALLVMWLVLRFRPQVVTLLPILFIAAHLISVYETGTTLDIGVPIHLSALRHTFLTISLPCIATGYLIHQYKEPLLKSLKVELWLLCFVIAAALEHLLRIELCGSSCIYLLATYPLVVFLMLICAKYDNYPMPFISGLGRLHSPNIYYFHGLIIMYLCEIGVPDCYGLVLAFCVYIACIPFSYMFNLVSRFWKTSIWRPFMRVLASRISCVR